MMSSEADHQRSEGASTVRTLAPGRRFKPYDVANPSNIFDEQVIVEIVHTAHDRSYATNEEGEPEYQNVFTAIPSKVPATPHRTTKRPKIEGTQVALVAGPEGEEIHPDEYGRIKVWFPWDRRAKKDGSDTCWIRVAQNWAGAGWGGQIIPRIGMEVMVTHLDGDPDRPLVTGVVPNAKQKVPYKLPENKTKSVFRTNTHQSKNRNMHNEISFEDEAGWEEVYVKAERDMNVLVQHNELRRTHNNAASSVGNNRSTEVCGNDVKTVFGSHTMHVGGSAAQFSLSSSLGSLSSPLRGMAYALGLKSMPSVAPGTFTLAVDVGKSEIIGISSSEFVGVSKDINVGQLLNIDVGQSINVNAGNFYSEHIGEMKMTTVGERHEIVCGKSKILMELNGTITISGVKLIVEEEERMTVKAKKIELN